MFAEDFTVAGFPGLTTWAMHDICGLEIITEEAKDCWIKPTCFIYTPNMGLLWVVIVLMKI